ncbi:MAG: glycoside hydrolase [Chloroflexi bacterium]|jgi:alpha-amylase/alpha-mannosidase (GH57 family)|nr:glycoside hydrolase [Chloroflexota bacterium]
MKKLVKLLSIILLISVLTGCGSSGKKTEELPLYVNLTWHQHQPLYYKDDDGVYTRPWVRVHATKDYLDMAELVAQHPGMKATFNLTPSLIRQLTDFVENDARDLYWTLSEVPASELTDEQKTFILNRFFDANWDHIIAVHPRYQELLDLRDGTDADAITAALKIFTDQDFRDLQIWFNLAWVDPDYLAKEPFKALIDKGRGFTEDDKIVLFDGITEILAKVIPTHKDLQDQGIIEITTTPYAHPILPLIYDTNLALVGNPSAIMPQERFSYPEDAVYHLEKSVQMYEQYFGMPVRGLWPAEGSVAEDIVAMVSEAGYQWMQTGEPVLVASLGMEGDRFARDGADTVTDPDTFYRPYYVQGETGEPVAVFFRDWVLSDKVGFTYSGTPGEEAAQDMVDRLENIRASLEGTQGPHIVTIVVDGENAWENYDNDGKEFFHALYSKLASSETLETITPSEYLELYPEQHELPELFPGAWFSANYDTWIGEQEEADAWDLLINVRKDLEQYVDGKLNATPEALAEALDFMYLAEGSDWFWWYGTDQDSGQDSYFDEGYRALLKGVYTSLGVEVPTFLNIPIIQPQPLKPDTTISGESTPVVDGLLDEEEWETAAVFQGEEGDTIELFAYGMDQENLFFRFDLVEPMDEESTIEVYLNAMGDANKQMSALGGSQLVSPATRMIEIKTGKTFASLHLTDGTSWTTQDEEVGQLVVEGSLVEFSVPKSILGLVGSGSVVPAQVVYNGSLQIDTTAPLGIQYFSFAPFTSLLRIEDPEGDDFGPGFYTYPTDGVFKAGDFDLTFFELSSDGDNLYFTFGVKAEITNGWSSPSGFSVQTFDVYIDKDPGAATGARMLMPGRNAALAAENGWDVALWIEGWSPQVVVLDADGLPVNYTEATSAMKVYVDNSQNAVVASVPANFLVDGDPATWAFAVALLGQEGYPAAGVWRVRDVNENAEAYRFGGAPDDNNHTRIIDLLLPAGAELSQQDVLNTYPSSASPLEGKGPDYFAIIPLIKAE